MQRNINEEAQKGRRHDAWKSAVIATVWILLSASMLLLLRHYYVPEGFWNAVMQGAAEVIAYGTAVKLK